MPKSAIRTRLLTQRRSLSLEEVSAHSRSLQLRFLDSLLFKEATTIGIYSPIQGEVMTDLVFDAAITAGKKVLYPEVEGLELVFRQVMDREQQLNKGAFGVLEPDGSCPAVHLSETDVVIVPAVGYDFSGNRIGYGKGYYDRALHSLEGSGNLVGFCFDFQLLEDIAGEPHDVKVDWIFTESRVVQICRK